MTELLIQICDNAIPEVVSRLPQLRGPAGPVGPAGKLPIVEEWTRETVYYESSVVTYDGATYQALHDTGESPDNEAHWQCLAAPGRDAKSIRHRGTFKEDTEYAAYDAVALNGGSFLALRDKPGPCPGPAWQLLAAPGKRGATGEPGPRGPERRQQRPAIELARVDAILTKVDTCNREMFAAIRAQTEKGFASLRACIRAPSRAERKDDEPPKLN